MAADDTIQEQNPETALNNTKAAIATARDRFGRRVIGGVLPREPLPAGDPASESGTSVAFEELDEDLQDIVGVSGAPPIIEQLSTGRIEFAGFTLLGGRDVRVGAGRGVRKKGPPLEAVSPELVAVTWAAAVLTIPPNTTRYFAVDEAGTVFAMAGLPDINTHIFLGAAIANGTDIVWLSHVDIDLIQKVADRAAWLRDTVGPLFVTGLDVQKYSPPSLRFAMDAGVYYLLEDRKTAAVISPATFTYWYRDGSGGWTSVPGQTDIDPGFYDDGSGVLAAIPAGEWKQDLIFISPLSNTAGELHVVYAQQTYITQALAETGNVPVARDEFLSFSLRLAGPVVQEGDVEITSLVDHRPRLGQLAPSQALQAHTIGGPTHAPSTLAELNALISDANLDDDGDPRDPNPHAITHESGGGDELDLTGMTGLLGTAQIPVAHAGTHENGGGDELDVTGLSGLLADQQTPLPHAVSHQHGGGDEVATPTPGANAIPKANGAGNLASGWGGAASSLGTLDGSAEQPLAQLKTMTGATAGGDGARGSVPQPLATQQGRILRGSGVWDTFGPAIVEATGTITTTSTTDILATGMTITPPAGTYLAVFTGNIGNEDSSTSSFASIWSAGAQVAASEREATNGSTGNEGDDWRIPFHCEAEVTVDGAQAIEGRYRTTFGFDPAAMVNRQLKLIRIGA